MSARCPKCGNPYGFFDRLAQPTMCAACDGKYSEPSPLASFDDELAEIPPDRLAGVTAEQLHFRKLAIAKRNLFLGVTFLFMSAVITFLSLWAILSRPGNTGTFVFTVGLVLGGFDRLIRGIFQYRSLKRDERRRSLQALEG